MEKNNIETSRNSRANQVEIWYCGGCKAVHLGVGETRVSFDRQRFSEFATMVAEIHYDSFENIGVFDLLNIANEIDVESTGERRSN
ncbi:MAG: hypothetical protein HOP17_01610 [Acidobacteria bacterium]|nr:hypothetical protein [Acidobacteriota bacterium]